MPFNLIQTAAQMLRNQNVQTVTRTARDLVLGYLDPVDQPQLAYMWEVSFEGLFSGDAKNLTFYAKTVAIPTMSTDVIKRFYAGQEYAYSSKDNSPRILRLTFWDNQRLDAYHYFQKWMFTMNDPQARRKVSPVNYQRRVNLDMKDTTDAFINERFVFDGVFPTEISEAVLTYDNSAEFTFDVMMHFHRRTSGEFGDTGANLGNFAGILRA